MNDDSSTILRIRKYSNRRFYDTTRSKPITLDQIHQMIKAGHEVEVTDSKTGEDITTRVLAQILLEMDTQKLQAFPTALLHNLIQSNESLMKDFVNKYFNQAFDLFLESKQVFDEQLRSATNLGATKFSGWDMAEKMRQQFVDTFSPKSSTVPKSEQDPGDLRSMIEDLQEQVKSLREELDDKSSHGTPSKRK